MSYYNNQNPYNPSAPQQGQGYNQGGYSNQPNRGPAPMPPAQGYGSNMGGYGNQPNRGAAPMPQSQGYGNPGAGGYSNQQYRSPAPTPQAQGVDRQWLLNVFQQVDKDRSGRIDSMELQASLANGSWQPFNIDTCNLMIGMFDRDNDKRINFDEFEKLWNFVDQWTRTFKQYDRDNSGSIDTNELKTCLSQFGYRLSDMMCDLMVQRFDRTKSYRVLFDDFVQLCIALQTVTGIFRDKDMDRDGVVTINYEEFLAMVFTLNVWDRKA